MDLKNTYIDFISVIPDGSFHNIKNQLKNCDLFNLKCIYTEINTDPNVKNLQKLNPECNQMIKQLHSLVMNEIQYRMNQIKFSVRSV